MVRPGVSYNGVFAYFHWNSQRQVSLILPDGGELAGSFNNEPLLAGNTKQRTLHFLTLDEVATAEPLLLDLADHWCEIHT
jgi:hypothetical protein